MTRRTTIRGRRPATAGLLLRTLRHRGLEVMTWSLLLVGVILSTAYVLAMSTYESSLLLKVAAQPGESAESLVTLAHLVASDDVMNGAAEDPALGDIPWFRDALRVEPIPAMSLIRLSARGTPDQAPRIVEAVAASIGRRRASAILASEAEVRNQAGIRLVELRARSDEIERTWRGYAERKAEGALDPHLDEVDLRGLAAERVAVRTRILESEAEQARPVAAEIDLARLGGLNTPAANTHAIGRSWFWAVAAAVGTIVPSLVLGLSMGLEARKARAEADRLRAQARDAAPAQGPLLIAIQLAHGDWRPHPAS
ncbi:hypothetical protein TA3x_000798 [Tundrisphaera sp. TA3]|uniref:hypothetical protein n=1 Tax=Tundrisphaera sp. TA3 TaxID=3435775 RepID=UPI003EBEE168